MKEVIIFSGLLICAVCAVLLVVIQIYYDIQMWIYRDEKGEKK